MEELIGIAFGWLFALTGRLAVRVFTLGRWQSEPFGSRESGVYSAAGALTYLRNDRRVVTETGTMLVGFALYFLVAALLIWNLIR